jgi:hypothetical protein
LPFTLEANIPEVTNSLRAFAHRQVPFASSLGINWTLKDAQKVVRENLPRRFTIRNAWTAKGVVVTPSNKRTLRGAIGHRDPVMALQEEGGEKRPRGKAIAIPTRSLLKTTAKGIVPRGKRPARILQAKTTFRGETAKGRAAILRRRGKASPIVLYTFHPSARIRPRFHFYDDVERTVNLRWNRNFGKALAKAIASSR